MKYTPPIIIVTLISLIALSSLVNGKQLATMEVKPIPGKPSQPRHVLDMFAGAFISVGVPVKSDDDDESDDESDESNTCPDGSSCVGGTCCLMQSGKYGCCKYPHAVCCDDKAHCCPAGYTCALGRHKCERGEEEIDSALQTPSIPSLPSIWWATGTLAADLSETDGLEQMMKNVVFSIDTERNLFLIMEPLSGVTIIYSPTTLRSVRSVRGQHPTYAQVTKLSSKAPCGIPTLCTAPHSSESAEGLFVCPQAMGALTWTFTSDSNTPSTISALNQDIGASWSLQVEEFGSGFSPDNQHLQEVEALIAEYNM